MARRTLAERFWAKVRQQPSGCWLWTGQVDREGYGLVTSKPRQSAHRMAWTLTRGPIPAGKLVRHYTCNNRQCCNPSHLRLGSHQQNMNDMVNSGRSKRGTAASGAKLTPTEVAKIKRLKMDEGLSDKALGSRFGVSHTTIWRLCRGLTHRK